MYAFELFEAGKPQVVVTYPGRFQPFHQGHAAVYAQLQKKFGRDNVYILTSNDTSGPKSPFSFSDKYQLMTAAGVPGDRIIETNNMYALPEAFDKASTIFVAAVGEPDKKRLNPDSVLKKDKKDAEGNVIKPAGSPGYFLSYDRPEPKVAADQHGYVIVIPEVKKTITIKGKAYDVSHGTECRNLWNAIRNDQKARVEFLTQLYGQASNELAHIFDKIPAMAEDVAAASQDTTSPIHGVTEDAAGVGVVAKNKKMARDPRYSMSITKDVKPETPKDMLRAFRLSEQEIDPADFEIRNFEKLDNILVKCCEMVVEGQKENSKLYGMVAACILDPNNNAVFGINTFDDGSDQRKHAERVAIENYTRRYGDIPKGSIIITTLSPCCHPMDERYGESCTDLINQSGVHKVYCGYKDPTQEPEDKMFHVMCTRNEKINSVCKKFADTFLNKANIDEGAHSVSERQMMRMIKRFMHLAVKELKISKVPHIVVQPHIESHGGQATFGRFVNEEEKIYLGVADRHPVDILRTLAHELVHFKQYEQGRMEPDSGTTGSPIENEAHAVAGVLMRHFNKKYPDAIKSKPLELDEAVHIDVTSDEYFLDPTENVRMGDFVFNARTFTGGLGNPNARGLQIRAYDPKNLESSIGSADFIVKTDKKGNSWLESDDTEVDELYRGKGVAAMMYAFARSLGNDIKDSPYKSKAGSDMWAKWGSDAKHLTSENFADGRNPQDKGDSKRYNVPTKGSISSLRKIAKQGGRRGQLAHWMANMKSGKKKND